jgi:hypothetical protein
MVECEELLVWLRTMPDDKEFMSTVEIAMVSGRGAQ